MKHCGLFILRCLNLLGLCSHRNNLTVMDMLVVQGRGAHGQLKFGNQRPGSSSPLLFELAEKHLKDCEHLVEASAKSIEWRLIQFIQIPLRCICINYYFNKIIK